MNKVRKHARKLAKAGRAELHIITHASALICAADVVTHFSWVTVLAALALAVVVFAASGE